MKWANEHLLAGEKEYGLKVVTGAVLPKVKGNRKSAGGKGDIAIGKLVDMEHGDTFTFVNSLVELKIDRASIKTGQNLLELFALSMISKFGRGVALLATDCDKTLINDNSGPSKRTKVMFSLTNKSRYITPSTL